jgi:hypothetical protein
MADIIISSKSDFLTYIRNQAMANGNLSTRGVERCCGIANASLIDGVDFRVAKLGKILTDKGFHALDLIDNGFPPQAVWLCIEYYAFESKAKAQMAKHLARTFGSIGIMVTLKELAAPPPNELAQQRSKLEKQLLPTPTQKELKEGHGLYRLMYGKPYADRWLQSKIKEFYPALAPAEEPRPEEKASLPTVKALLTPTEIAVELEVFCKSNPSKGDARWVNQKLLELGYQEKIAGKWSATQKAIDLDLCDRKPVDTNSRTQKDQLVWSAQVVVILKEHALPAK